MWNLAALHLLPAQSVTQVCEEQVDGLTGQSHLGSRSLSANGVALNQEPSAWISAMGLLAALAGWTPSYCHFRVSLWSGTTQSRPGRMLYLKHATEDILWGGDLCA